MANPCLFYAQTILYILSHNIYLWDAAVGLSMGSTVAV